MLARGAVGDIALRFFDNYGQAIQTDVDERVIGINLDQLAQVKRVVGVAGGPEKKEAILGALRGGLVDVSDHGLNYGSKPAGHGGQEIDLWQCSGVLTCPKEEFNSKK